MYCLPSTQTCSFRGPLLKSSICGATMCDDVDEGGSPVQGRREEAQSADITPWKHLKSFRFPSNYQSHLLHRFPVISI